jgi:ComF family protein
MGEKLFRKGLAYGKTCLEVLIDFLFPRKKDALLFATLNTEDIVKKVHPSTHPEALFDYHDPLIHSLVWHAKYKGDPLAITHMATLLYDALYEEIADRLAFAGGGKALLVSIPSSKERMRYKGFNQVALIAEAIASEDKGQLFEHPTPLLFRKKEVGRQTDLKRRGERLKNMKEVFIVNNPTPVKGRIVVLIDDVTTTGATLSEARKALEKAKPAHIEVLAFAH